MFSAALNSSTCDRPAHTPRAPAEPQGRASLRAALRGRWLYALGDSSSRGLWISLYQQVARIEPPTTLTAALMGGQTALRYLRFIDVILNSSTGELVAAFRPPGRCHSAACTQPAGDMSEHLTAAWCSPAEPLGGSHERPGHALLGCSPVDGRTRLTWRMFTTADRLEAEAFAELGSGGRSGGPHIHVLQTGAWDDQAGTSAESFAASLHSGLLAWQRAARSSPGVLLVYATSPSPFRRAPGGDACGEWQASLWRRPDWRDVTANITLLNRVATAEQLLRSGLGARCPCLEPAARAAASPAASMRYHAPHAHNVADVQRLVGALRHQGQPHRAHEAPILDRIHLDHPIEACCCGAPPGARDAWDHTIDMWLGVCRVVE